MVTYTEWIADYRARTPTTRGRCVSACRTMVRAFPELTIVPGFARSAWGEEEHAWCVTKSGEIIDPTDNQFPGPITYRAWKPGDTVRVGKCANCGDNIYRAVDSLDGSQDTSICGTECARSYRAYLLSGADY